MSKNIPALELVREIDTVNSDNDDDIDVDIHIMAESSTSSVEKFDRYQQSALDLKEKELEIERRSQHWTGSCFNKKYDIDKGFLQYVVSTSVIIGGMIFTAVKLSADPGSQVFASLLTFLVGLVIPNK